MSKINQKIKTEDLKRFHEALIASGGRFLKNPEIYPDFTYVEYEMGDAQIFYRMTEIVIITEKPIDPLKAIKNRVRLFFRDLFNLD